RGAGADRRRAGPAAARAQHPQPLRQHPRHLAEGGAEPQANDPCRGGHPSRLGRRVCPPRRDPHAQNWVPYASPGATVDEVVDLFGVNTPAHAQTWRELEKYRRLFPRNLIVKGIMDPRDAIRAAELGCEGVIVSNHGGRQLDQAPASLDVLPAIKTAVGDRMTVMLDSGVRRGADILIAMCLGAQFCFFGRPTLYGAVAGGLPGGKKAMDIFRGEIDLTMGQIG